MDLEAVKRTIRDQEEDATAKLRTGNIVDREFLAEAGKALAGPNALVLTGVRRCGKSVASLLLARTHPSGYVNFDDPSLLGIRPSDLTAIVEAVYSLKGDVDFFILDEVQNVKGWELLVSRLRETKRVIVTGSNAGLLSKELSTRLTGRYLPFSVFPFSFREFLSLENFSPDPHLTRDVARTKSLLERYLSVGGFPEARLFGERFLLQVYEDIITKDVERRYSIRFRQTFREMAKYLVSNTAREVSFSRLKNVFGLKSVHTAKNYTAYLKDAYVVFLLERYSPKLKMQFMAPKKAYCIDTGMASVLGFRASEDRGRLMENLVAVELIRRRSYWDPRSELYYWKDHSQNEVDFVVKEGAGVSRLIQVCYDISDENAMRREVGSLLKASSDLGCKEMLVITWDYSGRRKGVRFLPLWSWLLEKAEPATGTRNL